MGWACVCVCRPKSTKTSTNTRFYFPLWKSTYPHIATDLIVDRNENGRGNTHTHTHTQERSPPRNEWMPIKVYSTQTSVNWIPKIFFSNISTSRESKFISNLDEARPNKIVSFDQTLNQLNFPFRFLLASPVECNWTHQRLSTTTTSSLWSCYEIMLPLSSGKMIFRQFSFITIAFISPQRTFRCIRASLHFWF